MSRISELPTVLVTIAPPADERAPAGRMAGELHFGARRLGIISGIALVALSVLYLFPLTMGLVTLASPLDPIADPWFTMMEILIILMSPLMVAFSVAIHYSARPAVRAVTLTAAALMTISATITGGLHFVLLTVSHVPAIAGEQWARYLLTFNWPSVPYALDILSWDVFFALAVLGAAFAFRGSRLAIWIRILLIVSGALSLAGLAGVPLGDMQVRNVGVVGYALVFPVAAALIVRNFWTSKVGVLDPTPVRHV